MSWSEAELAETSVADAREWLRERLDDGTKCPCCTQHAKVYRRKIHASIAAGLIRLYRAWEPHGGYVEIANHLSHRQLADFAKVRYWGLAVEEVDSTPRGRTGYWKMTDDGVGFVREGKRVPKYARLYDGRSLGLVGDPVSIRDCLGTRFNYHDLMAGR